MKYLNRDKTILSLCQNKKVLHLGAVGFTDISSEERTQLYRRTLHFKLTEICDVIGIDYAHDVIAQLKHQNITDTIIYGNVEKLADVPLNGTYDVLVIGDLIEHLGNPGLMLEGVQRFCGKQTIVIITTPNAFSLPSFLRFCFNKFKEGKEHVMSFNSINLTQLVDRYGLEIQSIDTCYQATAREQNPAFGILKQFFKLIPKFGGTLFIVARRHFG